MRTITAFIKRHAVLTYYVLVFAISWGGALVVVGPTGFPGTSAQVERLMLLVILAFLVGPALGGPVLTGLVYGRAGLRQFLSRLLKWRVAARWYPVALLTAPLLMMAVLLALSLFSREFIPGIFTSNDRATLLLVGNCLLSHSMPTCTPQFVNVCRYSAPRQITSNLAIIVWSSCSRLWQCKTYRPRYGSKRMTTRASSPRSRAIVSFQPPSWAAGARSFRSRI